MAKVKPRVKVPKTAEVGELIEIKTLISHPMHSGRAVDGDGKLIPRRIINSFRASFNGTVVMSVDLKPSVSANPFFTFTSSPILPRRSMRSSRITCMFGSPYFTSNGSRASMRARLIAWASLRWFLRFTAVMRLGTIFPFSEM